MIWRILGSIVQDDDLRLGMIVVCLLIAYELEERYYRDA